MEMAKATGTKPERCWCMDAVFSPAVIDKVPDAAMGKACVCANCADAGNWSAEIYFESELRFLAENEYGNN